MKNKTVTEVKEAFAIVREDHDGSWIALAVTSFDDYQSKPSVVTDGKSNYLKRGWNSDRCEVYYQKSGEYVTKVWSSIA